MSTSEWAPSKNATSSTARCLASRAPSQPKLGQRIRILPAQHLYPMKIRWFAPEFTLEWALQDVDLVDAAAWTLPLPGPSACGRGRRHGREDVSATRLALGKSYREPVIHRSGEVSA
jgi:hypothetical protein